MTHRFLRPDRLARFFSVAVAQAGAQSLMFLCGIVLVRSMSSQEYGYYTLVLSIMGVGAVLMDLGLASGVLAVGGRTDPTDFREIIRQADGLRRRIAYLSGPVLAVAGFMMLKRQGAPVHQVIALELLALVTAFWTVRSQVGLQLLRLLNGISAQQRLDLMVNSVRLLTLVALTVLLGALSALIASVILVLAAILYWTWLTRQLHKRLSPESGVFEPTILQTIAHGLRSQVRHQAPNSLYFVFNSQINVWLIGWFGNSVTVAKLGALGRLAVAFTLIDAVAGSLIYPWFARQREFRNIRQGIAFVHATYLGLIVAMQAFAWYAPQVLLFILGAKYSDLSRELAWMLLAGCLASWGAVLYSIGSARGWVLPFAIFAPSGFLAVAVSASMADLTTVRGGFVISVATGATGVILTTCHLIWRLRYSSHR